MRTPTRRGSRGVLLLATLFAALWAAIPAAAHEATAGAALGFEERLGATVAKDESFTAEDGSSLRFGQLLGKPLLLDFVYYRCKDQCTSLLVGISQALHGVEAAPGRDYDVVTVSVNPEEGPADAREKKALALAAIEKPFPPEAWRFLVGTDASIDELADSVGFSYTRKGDDFDHPLGIIVLSPQGKVVRYMPGTEFLPVDLSMSILEASAGIARPTIAKVLRFCMSYDPATRRFGFNVLRVSGIVISVLVGAFVLYLVLGGMRRRRRPQGS
jgi:protein SCO1/2